ncbi:hypothetical protein [Actinophytocola sp. KF-1]
MRRAALSAVAFPLVFAAEMPWWVTVLVEVVVAAALVPLGLLLWFDAAERKADTVRLRRSGVPPFAATYRGRPDEEYRVGGLLYATVDPAGNLFTLQRL